MLIDIEIVLKNILLKKNLSMKELVAKIGMTENGFAYSIKNKTVKLITLEKIAEVLEVPVSYFFGEGDTGLPKGKEATGAVSSLKEATHEIEKLKIEISSLKKENEDLRNDKQFLQSLIKRD